ncbi:MAG: hypothetical protein QME68_07495, partial [Elusimicrobiota bacterium]|nr:hypothetical protein [Elusimicrobiota bacterium]
MKKNLLSVMNTPEFSNLSFEEQVDYLSGLAGVLDSMGSVSLPKGDFSLIDWTSVARSDNGAQRVESFVLGAVPVIEKTKDTGVRTQLSNSVKTAVNTLTDNIKNNSPPSIETVSNLANIAAYILDSRLDSKIKYELVASLLTTLHTALNSINLPVNITKDSPVSQQEQFDKMLALVSNLERLSSAIIGIRNTDLLTLFIASVISNPQLRTATELSVIASPKGEAISSLLDVMNTANKFSVEDLNNILNILYDVGENIITTNPQVANILTNFVATVVANKVRMGQKVNVVSRKLNSVVAQFI